MKKQEFKKVKSDLQTSGTTWNIPNYIWILGVPEGEQQQETENLFEQIMKENFPNLVNEIDF